MFFTPPIFRRPTKPLALFLLASIAFCNTCIKAADAAPSINVDKDGVVTATFSLPTFFRLAMASPNFYSEPWIDSALFHRGHSGQKRVFNLKSHEQSNDDSPLHMIGFMEGDRYVVEMHVDTHRDKDFGHAVFDRTYAA
jgi:hypothetical protein